MKRLNQGMRLMQWIACLAILFVGSCSSDNHSDEPEPSVPEILPIKLSCSIAALTSRATDTNFETGDRVGLYVANYVEDKIPILQNTGNHVDNQPFSYSGTWTSQSLVYWKDKTTPADFYAYYPYTATLSNIAAYPAETQTDQSTETAYRSSNFLWGKTTKVRPTESAVRITLAPLFSRIVVGITAGKGLTVNDLKNAHIQVTLTNAYYKAMLNLSDGTATPTGEISDIHFLQDLNEQKFRAWIVPQNIALNTGLIAVSINGKTDTIEQNFFFEGGKQYSFTMTVNKTEDGLQVDISDWDTDDMDYGGTVS